MDRLPFSLGIWSGKRGSNSRPQPWQGCALPTELFPRFSREIIRVSTLLWQLLAPRLRQRGLEVIRHRDKGEQRREVNQPGPDPLRVEHADGVVIEQERDGDHL